MKPEISHYPPQSKTGRFSFFNKPITNLIPDGTMYLDELYKRIIGPAYLKATAKYRESLANPDESERQNLKKQLFDYVTFSGTFSRRSENNLISKSWLIAIDIDNVSNPEAMKQVLKSDPCIKTALLYTTPSGKGLKWVIWIEHKTISHTQFYSAVANYLMCTYNVEVDLNAKDISRASFVCHDPKAIVTPLLSQSEKKFDPSKWMKSKRKNSNGQLINSSDVFASNAFSLVEAVIYEIESQRLDVTSEYSDWIRIGWALCAEFGELGRTFFHRVSQFHPEYQRHETDSKYTELSKSNRGQIQIGTFFFIAGSHGIDIDRILNLLLDEKGDTSMKNSKVNLDLHTFSDAVFQNIPENLKDIIELAESKPERDALFLSCLISISSILPNTFGHYGGKIVYPNLYGYFTGPPSSGKSIVKLSRDIVYQIHKTYLEDYDENMSQYGEELKSMALNLENKEEPAKPIKRLLFIPANNSAAGFAQLLSENKGRGLLHETEGDVLNNTLRSDFGDISPLLRQAFHHEPFSQYRKTNKDHIEIENPCLSVILTGTVRQFQNLIRDEEDGLFSRFIYYRLPQSEVWKNQFIINSNSHQNAVNQLSDELCQLTFQLEMEQSPILFAFSKDQMSELNEFFSEEHKKYVEKGLEGFIPNIKRLGIISFRLAIILSSLRLTFEKDFPKKVVCSSKDFEIVKSMLPVLILHSHLHFTELNGDLKKVQSRTRIQEFFDNLPFTFDHQLYKTVSKSMGIGDSTADRYINKLVRDNSLYKPEQGQYIKHIPKEMRK